MPKIGMRMVKTAIAVAICLAIYQLRGEQGVPVFSTIAALICMQPQVENSVTVAFNRIVGTLIGAAMGLLVLYLLQWIPEAYDWMSGLVISLAMIPTLYLTVVLKKTGAAAMAGVVLLSVTLAESMYGPVIDALNRSFETIVGIVVSLVVNVVHLPRQRREEFFFVTGFDGALYHEKNHMSPYSVFELNQMLNDGIKFTIATERTPASLMSELGDLHLKLPVIAMDGAVLYDLNEKRYLACNGLSKEMTQRICDLLRKKELHYFLNVVLQDVLLIYYHEFRNEEEQKLYERARSSPYRNYVYGDVPEEGIPVYFLLVVKKEDADAAQQEIQQLEGAEELLFLRDTSETPEGYCHLKIYHKNATKEYMVRRLLENVTGMGNRKVVAFGSNKNDVSLMQWADLSYATAEASADVKAAADYQLRGKGGDSIVRTILHLYEPLLWEKVPVRRRVERGESDQ
ncbi:MAG TPA: HAD hydrolase family protein [Candidatus Anaerotignum merdipullorum]|nr:HAD hydrolase family protein [Candidatus Anaerotignum merdipullorum]